jgi:hypothetical protein
MNVRIAALLGFCLMATGILHGGIYSAGHDFVVNRFTGTYEFVPADSYDEEAGVPARLRERSALTSRRVGVRVARAGRGPVRVAREGR